MDTRRDFIKKAAMLSGGAGIWSSLPASVQRAIAINPEPGSTFYDAEHVVLLMQENRSFDHCFGSMKGVRGFNDPRAVSLPNSNSVWLQSNKAGETYSPFHLDIKDTKATWMGSLPHSWDSQVDARNGGKHDNWLEAKQSGNKEYKDMPLTLGYYDRGDLPFYYALADAFTVCDQHFCSCLTATMPNRIYFWTGTIRSQQIASSPANVYNSFVDYGSPASWITFPERLEEQGISWNIYQNELSVGVGFEGEEDDWLSNYDDNPLEYFSQYHVRFLPSHIMYMQQRADKLKQEIEKTSEASDARAKKQRLLDRITRDLEIFTLENFSKLSERDKSIHSKAFSTNLKDPFYHELTSLDYDDNGTKREMKIPKGDVLHQFRDDVQKGNLPTVSWLISPENFSDHPSAPWYGAWYVSEVLDILTKNPEVWKKTILILTYDENDGYFDHIPPFTAPDPGNPKSGKCSGGIDTSVDYVTEAQAQALKGKPKDPQRVSPVGLGYRVPFVVISPWSRGGRVNSQVFDHTSTLQFLEKFLTHKTGKPFIEENISPWRRTVCGDLTSIFRPYKGEGVNFPSFIKDNTFIESIFNARFKKMPSDFKVLTKEMIEQINPDPSSSPFLPQQEVGIRPSCPIPYEAYAEGKLVDGNKVFEIQMKAGDKIFGKGSAGIPYKVYEMKNFVIRDYAVVPGTELIDKWDLSGNIQQVGYHFRIYGPNGFFRECVGSGKDPDIEIHCKYEQKQLNSNKLTGNIALQIRNLAHGQDTIEIIDNGYKADPIIKFFKAGSDATIIIDLKKSFGWYDFTVKTKNDNSYLRRYAGHVETGEDSFSDPVIGKVNV